jgi:hypothetical protein
MPPAVGRLSGVPGDESSRAVDPVAVDESSAVSFSKS